MKKAKMTGILALAARRRNIGKRLGPADDAGLREALPSLSGDERRQAVALLAEGDMEWARECLATERSKRQDRWARKEAREG